MDKITNTRNKTIEALRSQGLSVSTDCGDIQIIPYDDGIANGVKIYLGDVLVAMVDCYRNQVIDDLPEESHFNLNDFDLNGDMEEQVLSALSDTFGYCVASCSFAISEKTVDVKDIQWDISGETPEARLLVYGNNPDIDEPLETIPLN